MGIPWNGWFPMENHIYKWMMTGGSPISGNLHIDIYMYICTPIDTVFVYVLTCVWAWRRKTYLQICKDLFHFCSTRIKACFMPSARHLAYHACGGHTHSGQVPKKSMAIFMVLRLHRDPWISILVFQRSGHPWDSDTQTPDSKMSCHCGGIPMEGYLVVFFFPPYFRHSWWISVSLLLCFSASLLFPASAHTLLCLSASPLSCFSVFCFMFYFHLPASLLRSFSASLLFCLLLCFSTVLLLRCFLFFCLSRVNNTQDALYKYTVNQP